MKKVGLVLLLMFIFKSNLEACGGCRDAFYPSELMRESGEKFKSLEFGLSQKIKKIGKELTKAFNEIEEENLKESSILLKLKKYQTLKSLEEKFLIQQNNKLQSLASEIRGAKK